MKDQILAELGDGVLRLPALIGDALLANARLKYYLSLLQAAQAHAAAPDAASLNLRREREAAGIEDASFDPVILASRMIEPGVLFVPGASRIATALADDLATLAAPLGRVAGHDEVAASYQARIDGQLRRLGAWEADRLSLDEVARVTDIGRGPDSLHQLVMDLHRDLVRLQAALAEESIDGARAFGIADDDRPLVRAFMAGVNGTAPLKLNHPGLGTTASRAGGDLCIQNDLGTTDLHVIVLTVRELAVSLSYTDVHASRERFFRSLLAPWPVEWQDMARGNGRFTLSVGTYRAPDAATLQRYLAHVGSRLVFLIDWRRARKALSRFVERRTARSLLAWSAARDVGHRGFLEIGAKALASAFERGQSPQLTYGAKLDEILGAGAAEALLQSVLRLSSEGLRAGRSRRLIADEIEAALQSHLDTTARVLLSWTSDHAALVTAIADRCHRELMQAGAEGASPQASRAALLASQWEVRADDIVRRAATLRLQASDTVLAPLAGAADLAADALEQATFLLTLLPAGAGPLANRALTPVAAAAGRACRAWVQCLECARELRRGDDGAALDDVLVAVDRLVEIEHETDAVARAAEARLVLDCASFRELHVMSRIAAALDAAVDALKRCGLLVRDFALAGAAGER